MENQVKSKLTLISLNIAMLAFFITTYVVSPTARSASPGNSSTLAVHVSSPARAIPIGISYGDTLVGDSSSVLAQTLDDAVAIGINTIRLDLNWKDIQPTSAIIYDWSNFDRVVQAARSRNLTLLPILAYTPAWARPQGCMTEKCAPANPYAFASFAAKAARRYASTGIHTWEIWNEPNTVNFWQPTPNVTQYVSLLRATTRKIRAVDPSAFIVSGGLAPTSTSQGNIAQLDFFGAFADQGGISYVNAIGYHPYSFPVPPAYNENWNAWKKIAGTSTSMESILVAHGGAHKKIWLTEYGAPTNGPGAMATPSNYNLALHPDHVDEALQAQMANDSIRLARSANYVGALYWYSYGDRGTSKSTVENFFGLRRFDGSPKPAWQSLQQAILATN